MATYRSSAPSLLVAVPVVAGSTALALLGLVLGIDQDPWYFALYPLFMGATWSLLAVVLIPHIKVTADGVVTRNVFHKIDMPWSAIKCVRASSRVEVVLLDGNVIQCWAVQTPNWQLMLNKPGRADVVASKIEAAAERSAPHSGGAPGAVRRTVNCAASWWTLGIGAVLLVLVLIP